MADRPIYDSVPLTVSISSGGTRWLPWLLWWIMRAKILLSTLLGWTVLATADENWPQFRGPRGDGHVDGASLPVAVDASQVRWETPIHGKGWSSPVVWGDQIWLTTATEDGKRMSVICVDRETGKVVHDVVVQENEEPAFCHPTNSYASPTPVVEEGRVYVHFGSYLTACLDTKTAEVLWARRDLKCDHHRGPASSPILYDDKLIVAYDGFDVQFVVAPIRRRAKRFGSGIERSTTGPTMVT